MFDVFQEQLKKLSERIEEVAKHPALPDHHHNGLDSSRIYFSDLATRKFWFPHTIVGTGAATAGNYGAFFIIPFTACYLSDFKEAHQTAGSDASAVTLDLEKLTGTQAPDGGVSMLASTLSLKATANSVQTATLSSTLTNRNLVLGDRLCLKDSGTLTAVANVNVLVELTIV